MLNPKSLSAAMLLSAASLLVVPNARADGKPSASLAALKGQMDSVEADLTAGNLKRIHHFAEGINAAVKDLDQDPSLDETRKKRVAGYLKNIPKLTDAMHDAADGKNLPETKSREKKLKAQIDLLVKQFSPTSKSKAAKNDSPTEQ
ncbi:MAG: hypothetical protein ABI036_03195 [Fibrobacteria bacterium]